MSRDSDRHEGGDRHRVVETGGNDAPDGRELLRRPKRQSRHRLTILLVLSTMISAPFLAAQADQGEDESDPKPLTLQQALGFASGHPRTQSSEAAALFPRRQPLYLGCHEFSFTGTPGRDDSRDVAWSKLLTAEDQQRMEITQRFYDVLLADLSYSRDNEAMAVAYVQFDRAAAREELGQFSPLAVAELDAAYQLVRRQRAASEAAQLITRSLLAQAMGRPEDLPRDLVTPDLNPQQAPLPELDAVVAEAMEKNPRIKELMTGGSGAERMLVEMEVRQQALELLTRLNLLNVIAEQARSESNWRDLKLDESRTMYELEAKADLGFSMSQQTKARRDEEQVALCTILTRAELEALQGHAAP